MQRNRGGLYLNEGRGLVQGRHVPTSVLLLFFALLACAGAQELEGDWCATDDGDDGICRALRHCPSLVSKSYIYNGAGANTPGLCSYGDRGAIICCPVNKPADEDVTKTRNENQPSSDDDTVVVSAPETVPVAGGSIAMRMSELKCQEYTKEVLDAVPARTGGERRSSLSSLSEQERCPFPSPVNQLIVGGNTVDYGEYPHMAALGYLMPSNEVKWLCGGSLISQSFVLTAAHCTKDSYSEGKLTVIRLGQLLVRPTPYTTLRSRMDSSSENSSDYSVAKIIRHPDYKFYAVYNDIALIRLTEPVKQFNLFVRPACLYTEPENKGYNIASATGWGNIDYGVSPEEKLLKHVDLKLFDLTLCNSLYKAEATTAAFSRGVVESMLCAGELAGGKDTCDGDSGGPLQVRDENDKCIFRIMGVTSLGKGCGATKSLGVYSRVSYFLPWIENVVWP